MTLAKQQQQTWSLEPATWENISPQKNGCAPGSNGLFSYSKKKNGNYVAESRDEFEETPFHGALRTYLSYFFLIIFGYFRDFTRNHGLEKYKAVKENGNEVRNNFN